MYIYIIDMYLYDLIGKGKLMDDSFSLAQQENGEK